MVNEEVSQDMENPAENDDLGLSLTKMSVSFLFSLNLTLSKRVNP